MTSSVPSHQQQDPTTPLLPSSSTSISTSTSTSVPKSPAREFTAASATMLNTVVSGAAFGAALVASGVYQPAVIIGQLKLENWHMLQAFLAATASSAVFIAALDKFGHSHHPPQPSISLNIFAKHDGNFVGGALLGTGMALSGACPGTVLAQVGVGIKSGYYAFDGAILAGVFWTVILRPILNPCHAKPEATGPPLKLTVHEHMRCSRGAILVGFQLVCAAACAATVLLAGPSPTAKLVSPVVGGLLIGLTQLYSLVTRKTLLGASSAYEVAANYATWLVKGAGANSRPKDFAKIFFAGGMFSGAWALAHFFPEFVEGAAVAVPPVLAISGGFLMVLGARIADGCTSGHGLSGLSMFNVSSFITIGTALAVGVLVRAVVMPALGA